MPRDDDDEKRSSKGYDSKQGEDEYVTAVGGVPPSAEPKQQLGLKGLDISAVVKSERNPRPCEEHERVERALDAQVPPQRLGRSSSKDSARRARTSGWRRCMRHSPSAT